MMDKILIRGGQRLFGEISIGGAKNAALPLMAASLLTSSTLRLANMPHLVDIVTMASLLAQHGVAIALDGAVPGGHAGQVMTLNAREINNVQAPYDLVRKMRASVLVLGPLVAREGMARVSLPGGCAIGARPVDLHIKGLVQLGAEIDLNEGYIDARAPKGLHGGRIVFPHVSVGATENLLMAATIARGETVLVNAAREPEVVDLANCLKSMGANIDGIGTDTLTIQGVSELHGADHSVVADRIQAGTYAVAAVITKGEIELINASRPSLASFIDKIVEAGAEITETSRGLKVKQHETSNLAGVDIMTEHFPGFPTDLQAQMMALMSVSNGAALITETVFENRFMHVLELARMGADITVHRNSALVRGTRKLTGVPVMATDLRASVALIIAGLVAEGETIINRVYHLDRGYERIEEKLNACGADIRRVRG